MNFLFFWRFSREKGFDLIIEALSRLAKRPEGLPGNFCIFGEGDLKNRLFETFADNPVFEDGSGLSGGEILDKIEVLSTSEGEGTDWNEEIPPTPLCQGGNKIYFFGWQSKAVIESVLEVSHFSLMPSRFLETFGLSALESLAEGVPVIGFKKGWLVPFVPDKLAIPFSERDEENIEALVNKLLEVSSPTADSSLTDLRPLEERGCASNPLSRHSGSSTLWGRAREGDDTENTGMHWKSLSNASRLIADSYTEGRWMRQVRDMLPKNTKKILIATDYVTLLGGIETHVQTIAYALRRHGYEVEVFGWDLPKGKWTKMLRLAGLVYSLCNITSALAVRKNIREFEPDAIWLHSVSRFLGPLTVREVVKWGQEKWIEANEKSPLTPLSKGGTEGGGINEDQQWGPQEQSSHFAETSTLVTYHDLGLWSPFPSRVESESMVPKNPSLGAFLGAITSGNPITYLAAYCKYFQIFILRKLLKDIDIHIVPSSFLVRFVRDISEIPEERVVVLEHFL